MTAVNVTGDVESSKILEITAEDVERHIQQNDTVIIDVRKFNEVDEFGKIPTAHVLPGCITCQTYSLREQICWNIAAEKCS